MINNNYLILIELIFEYYIGTGENDKIDFFNEKYLLYLFFCNSKI